MHRLRDGGGVDDDLTAARERVRGARVGQVGLPVVRGLAGHGAVPGGKPEIGGAHVVARRLQPRYERPSDLASGAGDESPHASEVGDGVLDDRRLAAEEVEVAALVGLQDAVRVEQPVSADVGA